MKQKAVTNGFKFELVDNINILKKLLHKKVLREVYLHTHNENNSYKS